MTSTNTATPQGKQAQTDNDSPLERATKVLVVMETPTFGQNLFPAFNLDQQKDFAASFYNAKRKSSSKTRTS